MLQISSVLENLECGKLKVSAKRKREYEEKNLMRNGGSFIPSRIVRLGAETSQSPERLDIPGVGA